MLKWTHYPQLRVIALLIFFGFGAMGILNENARLAEIGPVAGGGPNGEAFDIRTDGPGGTPGPEVAILNAVGYNLKTPAQMVAGLISLVQQMQIRNQGSSFTDQLQQVETDINTRNRQACGDLKGFTNHLRAQTGKTVTTAQANQILAAVAEIQAALGCFLNLGGRGRHAPNGLGS
jgi:hypothetical protein